MEDLQKSKKYDELFSRVDKKVLFTVFQELFDEIPDNQKYDIFIDLYVRSEFGFEKLPKDILEKCFRVRQLSSEWKQRMQELSKLKKNPDGTVTVYRGEGSRSTKDGMSWTLTRKIAKFFANRFGQSGKVVTKKVKPEEIMDYLQDRGEAEVLLFK